MPPTIQTLWDQLTPAHQALVTELVAALVGTPPVAEADELAALFAGWEAEDAALTPAEAAVAAAEWRDIQAALNANRAPEPPAPPFYMP